METEHLEPKLTASHVTKDTLRVGSKTMVESASPIGRFQCVFEDDTETGYFYALDMDRAGNPIVDALHIYNVKDVTDRDTPSTLHILWSPDANRAAIFINSYPHAIFDFSGGVGCCRTGFPEPASGSGSHDWDESLLAPFFASDTQDGG
ncbi:hypothetical protein LF1_55670 [Rubripirellula obstinata]|uniref:DUF2251 domain-containing protein n=1 Tax=Rubripirellula obstinata TaxID=406547 RepID=A0A5B1C7V1_9BACT|nr:DUF2251 domain-containing protein [Rubripirellula obstinata]KAA1257167.1 hypothetical protein LF1_55670 [Rubripirellula obstinata]